MTCCYKEYLLDNDNLHGDEPWARSEDGGIRQQYRQDIRNLQGLRSYLQKLIGFTL